MRSRGTGYVWIRRYRERGLDGLVEQSRAAWRHGNQTPGAIEGMVLELRPGAYAWGPAKLKRVLEREEPGRVWPAASTIGALLKREGLVVGRRNGGGQRPTVNRWRMRTERTGYGARISKAGFVLETGGG